ncbi:hypothetical protein WJT86_05015 [Microvirga sp. W0021]|uniref:Uncharacterized protein n=1 Tax=Hohaiivirga grylli TaxID=3133970 RepID=A0ABV0BHG5_9HYPH
MTWNRTHKVEATIIPFPVDRAKEKKAELSKADKLGQILFFTGVRYERWDESYYDHQDDDHMPPRRGGSRS